MDSSLDLASSWLKLDLLLSVQVKSLAASLYSSVRRQNILTTGNSSAFTVFSNDVYTFFCKCTCLMYLHVHVPEPVHIRFCHQV